MKRNKVTWLILMVVALWVNCTKPYNPPAINAPSSYLVVEGAISDTTLVRLSNTVNLSSAISSIAVLGAQVTVASNGGGNVALAGVGNGYYQGTLALNNANTYQLRITTSDGKTYASDFVAPKNSPPIDSVNYKVQTNGVQFYASTHDASNNSRYYRWSYSETYQFTSAYASDLILTTTPKDTLISRTAAQEIYQCWLTDTSSNIVLGSSAKLAQDVIASQPVTFIGAGSEKLEDYYSILVRQYALTPAAFNYYQLLENNTTQLGSIFSAQPSQLTGNIHCTSNPAEIAIGYITAGTSSQKRLFIDSRNLPGWLPVTPYGGCTLDTLLFAEHVGGQIINQVATEIYSGNFGLLTAYPYGKILGNEYVLLGYIASSPFCVDCTIRGTNIKPGYWPY